MLHFNIITWKFHHVLFILIKNWAKFAKNTNFCKNYFKQAKTFFISWWEGMHRSFACTVGNKIVQALVKILPIFLWFDRQFNHHYDGYKKYNAWRSWLDRYFSLHCIRYVFSDRNYLKCSNNGGPTVLKNLNIDIYCFFTHLN